MSYPQKSVHPLERQGTTQRERLLKALLPENLLLDDRNMADLLAFAGDYAGQIRFWNQDNAPDGDWTSFWEQDITALLAIVASTDLDQLQVKFRSAELDFVRACKKEKKKEGTPYCEKALVKLNQLVGQIFEIAVLIDNIDSKLPRNHSVKTETDALIQGKLGILDKAGNKHFDAPLGRLISYHKGISTDSQLIGEYGALISNEPVWGLSVHDFLNCIDYRQITHKDQEDLWRLFLDFFKVLTIIVSRAGKAFQTALDNRGDHPPHIALFLSFCLLFKKYHQTELNGMAGRHLDYYYHDVLRLQERKEIPDRVHLVFEMARDLESYRLEKDILFLGGKDRNGNDLIYSLVDELVLNKAFIVERQNLYFYKEGENLIPVALPKADAKDGFKTPFPKDRKLWHPFWGVGIYKKMNARLNLLRHFTGKGPELPETAKLLEQRDKIIGRPGFMIASPELYLAKGGVREISISGIDPDVLEHFDVSVSTEKQVMVLPVYSEAIEFAIKVKKHKYKLAGSEETIELRYVAKGKLWISRSGDVSGYADFNMWDSEGIKMLKRVGRDFPNVGERVVFTGTGQIGESNIELALLFRDRKTPFKVNLKTQKGKPLDSFAVEDAEASIPENDSFTFNSASFEATGNLKKTTSGDSTELMMHSSFPDITPVSNDPWQPANLPFLRFSLKPGLDIDMLPEKRFDGIQISTANENLKNFNIQVGDTAYTTTSEIPLVGTNTGPVSYPFYIVAPEMSFKKIKTASLYSPELGNSQNWEDLVSKTESDAIFHPAEEASLDPADIDLNAPVTYSVNSPYAYFRKDYEITSNGANKPINIYKIPGQSILVSYKSEPVKIGLSTEKSLHKLYHIDYLGGYFLAKERTLIPTRRMPGFDTPIGMTNPAALERQNADGDLRLGIAGILPGQTLSMLFHFAEGTGDPDWIAPDEIVWSYLRENVWVRLPSQYILNDETLGLRKTGIIRFQIPGDINNGNTLALGEDGRKDLYWLQASATEDPDKRISLEALPQLTDIFAQAGTAIFKNNDNDLAHIDVGLPAASITQPRFRDASIAKVEQPYVSFDGLHAESTDKPAYYRRIQERLRHKNRAVTLWDYERLTLEKFPKVALVKCLPHTRDRDVSRPGFVTLGVVPYPAKMTGDTCYYPIFNAGDLEEIERYLNERNSYFLNGKHGGVVCCCTEPPGDSDCGCHGKGHLLIRNAIFEPVRLQVCVKFYIGKDELFYKKQLNNDLKSFLSPWATDEHSPLVFGTRIYTVELLRFLENLDYVDVVLGIKVKHFPDRETAENGEPMLDFEEVETIEPFTSRSMLTTYLDVLNEDNPNVLDHQILLAGEDGCEDCGC